MKLSTFCLCFALLYSIECPAARQNHNIAILSYNITASITGNCDSLDITAVCQISFGDSIQYSRLFLSSNCAVNSIRMLTRTDTFNIAFKFTGKDSLQIFFPPDAMTESVSTLEFNYKFPAGLPGDSLLLLDRGNRWYPLIPDQVSSIKLHCKVPAGFTVLSAGDNTEIKSFEGGKQFIWESKQPIFKLPLVIFKSSSYIKDSIKADGKNIVIYSLDKSVRAGFILSEAKKTFNYFSDLFGDYTYNDLTFIETPYFEGTNISSGLLMTGSASLHEMGRGEFESLYLTIAQQWIGACVFAKFGSPGFWFLTVSLPHYLRLMYILHDEGEDAFNKALNEPLKKYEEFAGKENDIPLLDIDYPNTREKGLIIYGKGPLVINRLHKQLGDEKWKSFLQNIYIDYRGKIITYDEFLQKISGFDMDGKAIELFKQLMTQKGMPE